MLTRVHFHAAIHDEIHGVAVLAFTKDRLHRPVFDLISYGRNRRKLLARDRLKQVNSLEKEHFLHRANHVGRPFVAGTPSPNWTPSIAKLRRVGKGDRCGQTWTSVGPFGYGELMQHGDVTVQSLARQLRALLVFQGELGLGGLEVSLANRDTPAPLGARRPVAFEPVAKAGVAVDERPKAPPRVLPARTSRTLSPALAAISDDIGDCQRCKLHQGRTHIVFGVGNPNARLLFVGEGPGRDEDLQGEPFVGAAGQLLDRMIKAMGLTRPEVYIANIVKCRPPGNRNPEPDEVIACEGFLKAQIRAVQPETIVALGRVAAQTLLGETTPVSRLRGHWREYQAVPLMPTFHPAYLLRNPADKRLVWEDLQAVMKRLALTPPRSL